MKRIFKRYEKNHSGKIVNIGSSSSYDGFENGSAYCSSKHAIIYNFQLGGLIPDSNIFMDSLHSFFESRRKSFEPHITKYVSKINEINKEK